YRVHRVVRNRAEVPGLVDEVGFDSHAQPGRMRIGHLDRKAMSPNRREAFRQRRLAAVYLVVLVSRREAERRRRQPIKVCEVRELVAIDVEPYRQGGVGADSEQAGIDIADRQLDSTVEI